MSKRAKSGVYLIEVDRDGWWIMLSLETDKIRARRIAKTLKKLFPDCAFRVVNVLCQPDE